MSDKRYAQWCGLAHALDRVGDRWTLLIVRELLIGPRRYSDLRANLPGIATNLLADRLRELERDGIVERREVPPPTPATVYELTQTGRDLEEAVLALIRWGGRFLPSAPKDDGFRAEWLALALKAVLEPKAASHPEAEVTLSVPDAELWLRIHGGEVSTGIGDVPAADLSVTGEPRLLLGLASGYLSLAEAEAMGLALAGAARSRRAFERLAA
jgi:DNA-binding HxlR family transcriptional regulator